MNFFLKENKVSIGYSKRFRSYYLNLKSSGGCQDIYYCPWCGKKLPKNLDNEYDTELSNVLKIPVDEISLYNYHDPNLPKEFKTDEWWKKRGL